MCTEAVMGLINDELVVFLTHFMVFGTSDRPIFSYVLIFLFVTLDATLGYKWMGRGLTKESNARPLNTLVLNQ